MKLTVYEPYDEGTIWENYPEGYTVTYKVYLSELTRRGVVYPEQYFPVLDE